MSLIRKLIAGKKSKTFQTNLLQQLEAAKNDKYYVKLMSYWPELCVGWKCWQVSFVAFRDGQPSHHSGEKTFMKLVGNDVVSFKEAVGTDKQSSYFRLIVPEGAVPSTLIASKRIIREKSDGDHAVSNGKIALPRLCSTSNNAEDYRFLHQMGERRRRKQRTFTKESELRDAAMPVIKAFLADVRSITQDQVDLPSIDHDFEVVTEDLIKNVTSWLEVQWIDFIPKETRDEFLARWMPYKSPCGIQSDKLSKPSKKRPRCI
jgi:hypothetical protein